MKYKRTSSSHEYSLEVEKSTYIGYPEYFLTSHVYLNNNSLDAIMIAKLTEDEINLDAGRFINFDKTPQLYQVQIVTNSLIYNTLHKSEELLNFIHNNITGKWNLSLWITSFNPDSKAIWDFSFSDSNEAVLFKLFFKID